MRPVRIIETAIARAQPRERRASESPERTRDWAITLDSSVLCPALFGRFVGDWPVGTERGQVREVPEATGQPTAEARCRCLCVHSSPGRLSRLTSLHLRHRLLPRPILRYRPSLVRLMRMQLHLRTNPQAS
jgi:hypothetical protein